VLLELRNVTKHFRLGGLLSGQRGVVHAVDDVSFAIAAGESFALVGESGCGKTTLAKLVLLLERPTAGAVLFDGRDIARLNRTDLRGYRRQVQAVFQDPYASLNPRLRVDRIIAEPILAHLRIDRKEVARRVAELLELVGLPASAARLYPHEFSGGQRQRIAIARALALRPRLLVLDEPTSALDVSIRAQILNLLLDLQAEFGLTYLMIAHDLAVVEHFSNRVGIVYLGRMVETGPTEAVLGHPRHPYAQALLAAVPRPDPDLPFPEIPLTGEIASALAPPPGCRFHPRCPQAVAACSVDVPVRTQLDGDRSVFCHVVGAGA
jgi:oligopeptide/dipeptide ABC transporter ATP-binding protein